MTYKRKGEKSQNKVGIRPNRILCETNFNETPKLGVWILVATIRHNENSFNYTLFTMNSVCRYVCYIYI